jgi:hypothetical protein
MVSEGERCLDFMASGTDVLSLFCSYVQDTFIDLLIKNGISFPGNILNHELLLSCIALCSNTPFDRSRQ